MIIASHALDQLGAAVDAGSFPAPDNVGELEFEIAGAYAVSTTARIGEIIYDGVLNEDVMRRFLITFDLANENIWFSKADQ